MAAKTLLLKLTRWEDSDGNVHWDLIQPAVAAVLAETEPKLKERLLKKPENLQKVAARGDGNAWEGPRLRFRWLVGESRTWDGEAVGCWIPGVPAFCRICFGAELPSYAYCLGCDRSGRDEVIGKGRRREEVRGKVAKFKPRGS